MTPPLWVDEQGRARPTRPCPRCQREIPVNLWPTRTLRTQGWRPYGVATFVEWCGSSARGRAGARGGRVVLGGPGAGSGAVGTLGA